MVYSYPELCKKVYPLWFNYTTVRKLSDIVLKEGLSESRWQSTQGPRSNFEIGGDGGGGAH